MNTNERKETLELIQQVAKKVQEQVGDWQKDANDTLVEIKDRVQALEQRKATDGGRFADTGTGAPDLIGHVVKSEQYKALLGGSTTRATIELPKGMLEASKAAIVSNGQVLSPAHRLAGIVADPLRARRVRELMPVGTTSNNLVEYTRENVFTNAAAPQYSSPSFENVAKAESAITFTLKEAPVRTLAHFIPVSKQAIADANYLQAFVSNRLVQGLKVKEDAQLLSGDGTGGGLEGILHTGNFTAAPSAVTGDNSLDVLLRAIAAIAVDEMVASAVLLHPNDWAELQMLKAADSGTYLLGKPGQATAPGLWGVPVVASTAITEGTFLVGDFAMGAQVWDREQASVQISFEHSDNFTKNMATILAEERLALTVYRPKAFRKGSF